MPILTPVPSDPAAQRAAAQANVPDHVKSMARNQLNGLIRMQNQGIKYLWHHPKLAPQEVCDAMGTDAGELFVTHGALTEAILGLAATLGVDAASQISLPTNNFTVNGDGTVTVLEEDYTPA